MSGARIWKWATTTVVGALVLVALVAVLGLLLRGMFGKGFTDGLGWLIGLIAIGAYGSRVDSQLHELRQENETLRGNLRRLEQSMDILREDMERGA